MNKHPTPFGVPIGHAVRGICRPILKKHGLYMADIFLSWKDVVGPYYARFTIPTKLQSLSEGQFTLHVQVPREQALEVRYDAPKLIARLNQYFGGEHIRALSLHVGEDVIALIEQNSASFEDQQPEQIEPSLETLLTRLHSHLRDPQK